MTSDQFHTMRRHGRAAAIIHRRHPSVSLRYLLERAADAEGITYRHGDNDTRLEFMGDDRRCERECSAGHYTRESDRAWRL